MLISKDHLQELLLQVVSQRIDQGCDIERHVYTERIDQAGDSYDALYAIARELRSPPLRADWPFHEPLAWNEIVAGSEQLKPAQVWPEPDLAAAGKNVRAAFLGSVCGCMLGKPLEVDPSLAELMRAGKAAGEWPIRNYVSHAYVKELGRQHDSVTETLRENIRYVAADDDIHYTVLGMLLLEEAGLGFSARDMYDKWAINLPPLWTWGPERTSLLTTAINNHHVFSGKRVENHHDVLLLNPGDELCGAMIRADPYGYACPGNPDLAAWLAWKDASFTHIKTGVYGAMFIAAVIALCHVADNKLSGNDRLQLIVEALRRIPSNTRFSAVVRDTLEKVSLAPDWLAGYEAIHDKYREYSHCRVFQEIGTIINTLKFADSIDHGFCIQVSQGNDTDSFGALSGSMLGAFFGEDHLRECWLSPFNNEIRHAVADFHEYDLNKLADRMSCLPAKIFAEFSAHGISE